PGAFGSTPCFGCQMVCPRASKNGDLVCQFIKEGVYGEYSQTHAFLEYGKMSVIAEYFDEALKVTPLWKNIADSMSKAQPVVRYEESQKWIEGLDTIFQAGLVDPKVSAQDIVSQILALSDSLRK
ncbi:MAG: hypothetical protein WCR70_10560, partial [Sphaerochaetaceae bacterium]